MTDDAYNGARSKSEGRAVRPDERTFPTRPSGEAGGALIPSDMTKAGGADERPPGLPPLPSDIRVPSSEFTNWLHDKDDFWSWVVFEAEHLSRRIARERYIDPYDLSMQAVLKIYSRVVSLEDPDAAERMWSGISSQRRCRAILRVMIRRAAVDQYRRERVRKDCSRTAIRGMSPMMRDMLGERRNDE